jgi:hypothetical protein
MAAASVRSGGLLNRQHDHTSPGRLAPVITLAVSSVFAGTPKCRSLGDMGPRIRMTKFDGSLDAPCVAPREIIFFRTMGEVVWNLWTGS